MYVCSMNLYMLLFMQMHVCAYTCVFICMKVHIRIVDKIKLKAAVLKLNMYYIN